MTLTTKLRDIVLATLLTINIASAPSRSEEEYIIKEDIYGGHITEEYAVVPEDKLYDMIKLTLQEIHSPKYADIKYHRSKIRVESNDKPNTRSHANARGLSQNTPIAWKQVSKRNYDSLAYNPQASITVGIKYTSYIDKYLSRQYPEWNKLSDRQKRDLNSAAYNGGPTRLRETGWDIGKMPKESREYVQKVNKIYNSL